MLDAHCHLDDSRLALTVGAELERARTLGIHGFVVAGVNPAGWIRQEALGASCPDVFNCFGLHPWWVSAASAEEVDRGVEELRAGFATGRFGGAVAIGEMGLDWFREPHGPGRDRQKEVFRAQLAIAREYNQPVVLHVVRAHAEALELIRKEGLPEAGGMVHSFHSSAEMASAWVDAGVHVSLSASSMRRGRRLKSAIQSIPEEWILLETDCPDQALGGGDSTLHGPATLVRIRDLVAEVRGCEAGALGRAAERNARRLFRLDTRPRRMG